MSKHILFDAVTNLLSARYDSEINKGNIPPEADVVSDDLFFRTIDEQDGIWEKVNGQIIKSPNPPKTTIQLINERLLKINTEFSKAMNAVVAGYPEKEISSWAKQETEARAYQANNNAITPLVDALSQARGLEKAELVSRIIAKADLFASVSGSLIGKRQALEDQLNALPENATAENVEAITWTN